MNPAEVRELARQGNPKAISTIVEQALGDRQVKAKAKLEDKCLHLLIEGSTSVPDRYETVDVVRVKLVGLDSPALERAKVYGRQAGRERSAWHQEFALVVGEYSNLVFSHSQELKHERDETESAELPAVPRSAISPHKPAVEATGRSQFSNWAVVAIVLLMLVLVALGAYVIADRLGLDDGEATPPPSLQP